MSRQSKFCCYQFCRPDGTPYYIGAGVLGRQNWGTRNPEAEEITQEIVSSGGEVHKIVEVFDTREEAVTRELELVNKHGRTVDGGILTNKRLGDRGEAQGRKLSPVKWRR